ncbi:MAG TPA: metal ABC transporter permease [Patescibacteria group bacterium]|nr:metal ABC transporter permease [Patescibacteria group bacterium]
MGIELLEYDFMWRALLAGWIVATVCPMLGMFIVVRKQSLIGDGLGHVAFAGVTGGYLAGIYPLAGALVFTLAGAAGIEWIRRRQAEHADVSLALIFYSGLAMAIIFSSVTRMPSAGLLGFLFGSILTVSGPDIVLMSICALVAGTVIWRLFDQLVLLSFDEDVARVSGISTGWISMILSLLTAIVVVVGMMVVGVLLVSAMMVIPVAAADLFGKGFKTTLFVAVLIALIAVTIGLVISFYGNVAPGGAVIMTTVVIYVLVSLMRSVQRRMK